MVADQHRGLHGARDHPSAFALAVAAFHGRAARARGPAGFAGNQGSGARRLCHARPTAGERAHRLRAARHRRHGRARSRRRLWCVGSYRAAAVGQGRAPLLRPRGKTRSTFSVGEPAMPVMNEENSELHEALHAIAADQDLALAQMPHATDAVAEEAMRRGWTRRRRPILPYFAVAGLAGAAAFAVAFLVLRTGRKDLHFEVAGRAGQAGASVTAVAGTPLPLQFSDGSKLVFQPGAQARVSRLTDNGAELLLEAGLLLADVRHTGEAHWSVSAGPFKVIVTGTRFAAEWAPATRKLSVEMFEGSVLVEGPSLGAGLALRAGETLEVGASSLAVVTRTVKAAAAVTSGPPAASEPGPVPTGAAEGPGPSLTARLPPEEPAQALEAMPQRPLSTWTDLAGAGR